MARSEDDDYVKLTLIDGLESIKLKIESNFESPAIEKEDGGGSDSSLHYDEESNDSMLLFRYRERFVRFFRRHSRSLKRLFLAMVFAGYFVYYGFAMAYSVSGATALTVFTCLGVAGIAAYGGYELYGSQMKSLLLDPVQARLKDHWNWIPWVFWTVVLSVSVLVIFLWIIESSQQFRGFVGAVVFLLVAYFTSKRPDKVQWQYVGIGLFGQFILGLLILRWPTGYEAAYFLFKEIFQFGFYYPMSGASVAYGDPFFLFHPIAMFVSSALIYAICVAGILYNLFRAIRLVRKFKRWFPYSTNSQLHLCLVSSHAVASSYALTFVSFTGVNVHHIVTGMLLCIPAAASFSLINFPNTEKSSYSKEIDIIKDAKPRTTSNIFVIGAKGCFVGAKTVALVYAHCLAFISIYAMLDAVYIWLAGRVGFTTSIVETLGYAFMPVAYLMGVRWEDCYVVGCLVAEKTFGLVLSAFGQIGYTISINAMAADTAVIATHALLGFSVFGTLAVYMGLFRAVGVRQRPRMLAVFPRAMFNAHVACFYAASVAVVLSPLSEYVDPGTTSPRRLMVSWLLKSLPSYKDFINAAG